MKLPLLTIAFLTIGLVGCSKSQEPSDEPTAPPKPSEAAVTHKQAKPEPGERLPNEMAPESRTTAGEDEEVHPRLVEMLNSAADYGRRGENARSLEQYDALLALQISEKLTAAPRFLATAQMQRAYALMDLGRLEEAERAFVELDSSTFSGEQLYGFHYSVGNVYGALRKPREMFASMVEAISAAEELDDFSARPQQCWKQILAFAMHAEDWAYVIELADRAEQVAGVRDFPEIAELAKAARQQAQAKQKK